MRSGIERKDNSDVEEYFRQLKLTQRKKDKRKWLCRILGAIYVAFSIFLFLNGDEMSFFAVIILIGGIVFFVIAKGRMYNNGVENIRRINDGEKVTIDKVYHALKDLETGFGKPWIGRIVNISSPCIIWGPNQREEIICAYKMENTKSMYLFMYQGREYISQGPEDQMNYEQNRKEHDARLEIYENGIDLDYQKRLCYQFFQNMVLDDLCYEINMYVKKRKIVPFPGAVTESGIMCGQLYRFDEHFKHTRKKFGMYTMDGELVYEIEASYPLKDFSIKEAGSEDILFSMGIGRRYIKPMYTLLEKGQIYALFYKPPDLMQPFVMQSVRGGDWMLRSVNTDFGHMFQVLLNGEVVGGICENLTMDNFEYDNCVIYVRKEECRPVITVLAIMVVRGRAGSEKKKMHPLPHFQKATLI